jgi:hypothetical protein
MFPLALKGNAASLHELQALVRNNELDKATSMFARLTRVSVSAARPQVEHEAEFLRIIDASRAIGAAHSRAGLNPRQAIIFAAATGWHGDDPSPWQSPATERTLLAWANSHYQGPSADLALALRATTSEKLFFTVHPSVFSETCYYCTFDTDFLDELDRAEDVRAIWEDITYEYDQEHGKRWRQDGICAGQGSEGPSDAPWGPCLGSSCIWFRDGKDDCNWQLPFARN